MKRKQFVKGHLRNNRAFTLIEIIAVLIIIAIMAAVVISRMTSTADVDMRAKSEALKNHIRYAQGRALKMNSSVTGCNAPFGISIGANSYFLFYDCSKNNKVTLPGANNTVVSVPGMNLTAQDITFDSWGRPCTDLTGTTLAGSDISVGHGIVITKNTGFVQ